MAAYLNRPGELGIVKPGALSDLLLLNGNPLQDINQTSNIEGIMVGNHWLSKDFIKQELKKLVKR